MGPGRHRPATSKTVVIGATALPLLSPSDERVSIIVSTTTNDIWISTNPAMAVGQGLHIPATAQPLEFCSCHFGTELQKAWYAIAGGAGTNVFVMEGFDPWQPNDNH